MSVHRMKPRFAALALLAALPAFLVCPGGCGAARKMPDAQTSVSASAKDGDITVTLAARPRVAGAGDTVGLTLTVSNSSGEPRTFEVTSAQAFDFVAQSGGDEIWRWSSGMSFAQVLTPLTIEAGGSEVYRAAWETEGVEPGDYTVTGTFAGLPELKPTTALTISE